MNKLELLIKGAGAQTMFFIHGWPDGPELWNETVAAFSSQYRCACVTLPGYSAQDEGKLKPNFAELTHLLAQTIQELQKDQEHKKIILVGHDWGAYLAYMVEQKYPDLVDRLITLDIGGHNKATGPKMVAMMLGYQCALITAEKIGSLSPKIGDSITSTMARILKAPNPAPANIKMNYLYRHLWQGLLSKKDSSALLKKYTPQSPTLFLYGAKKPFMFHSDYWLKKISALPGSKVVEMKGSGHWIMRDEPQKMIELLKDFLARK